MAEGLPWKIIRELLDRALGRRTEMSDEQLANRMRSDLWWLGSFCIAASAATVLYLLFKAVT